MVLAGFVGFVGGFGWFWLVLLVVLAGFGWFWLVACFSSYPQRLLYLLLHNQHIHAEVINSFRHLSGVVVASIKVLRI